MHSYYFDRANENMQHIFFYYISFIHKMSHERIPFTGLNASGGLEMIINIYINILSFPHKPVI